MATPSALFWPVPLLPSPCVRRRAIMTRPTADPLTVIAQQFNAARAAISTQTGASTYSSNERPIAAAPGGDNQL